MLHKEEAVKLQSEIKCRQAEVEDKTKQCSELEQEVKTQVEYKIIDYMTIGLLPVEIRNMIGQLL